jgi:hypothetical protein
MANHEVIELDHDPLEFLDGEGLGSLVSPQQGVAEVAKADQEMAAALDVYEALAICLNIVPGVVVLCAEKVGLSFKVNLKLVGVQVASATIGLNKCQTLQGNFILAKASIKVCFQGTSLTYQAQACTRSNPFGAWNCVNKNGTLFSL